MGLMVCHGHFSGHQTIARPLQVISVVSFPDPHSWSGDWGLGTRLHNPNFSGKDRQYAALLHLLSSNLSLTPYSQFEEKNPPVGGQRVLITAAVMDSVMQARAAPSPWQEKGLARQTSVQFNNMLPNK